jgi:hypothetical protein
MLLGLPGVNAVGLSLRTTGGERVAEFALIVHVTEKKPLDEIPPEERVPPEIEGVKTDVVVGGPFRAGAGGDMDDSKYRPVRGGSRVRADDKDPSGSGTLGCIVVNQDPAITDPGKQFLLLTNAHVLFYPPTGLHRTGEKVGQPDSCSICSFCCDHTIARLDHDGVLSGSKLTDPLTAAPGVDAAVATLDADTEWLPELIMGGEGGSITTVPIAGTHPLTDADALFDMSTPPKPIFGVRKRGARSRVREGWVEDIHLTLRADFRAPERPSEPPFERRFKDQLKIVSKTPQVAFALEGDSGSAVLSDANMVVGLVSGVPADDTPVTDPGFVIATAVPIAAVETQLKVKVADTAMYHGVQKVPKSTGAHAMAAMPEEPLVARRFKDAERDLRTTPVGVRIAEAAWSHVPEIRRLVNTNKRVAVVWRRIEGVRWLEQGVQCVLDRARPFPTEVSERSLGDCVAALMQMLEEYGSNALARDASWLGGLLPMFAGRSFDDVLALCRAANDERALALLAGRA